MWVFYDDHIAYEQLDKFSDKIFSINSGGFFYEWKFDHLHLLPARSLIFFSIIKYKNKFIIASLC